MSSGVVETLVGMVCPRCGGKAFYSHQLSSCKHCAKARAAARYQTKRDAILAHLRATHQPQTNGYARKDCGLCGGSFKPDSGFQKFCPTCRGAARKRAKTRWATGHPDEVRATKRASYARNREVNAAYWRSPRGRELNRRYQRMRRDGRDPLAIAYGDVVVADPCSYCDQPSTGVDHIIALDGGGANHWSNLTGACSRCNSGKQTKPLLLFLAGR
jgi:5-methylcytosine-specific restriction endonuclease McrA